MTKICNCKNSRKPFFLSDFQNI
uniref:Uncharacterized protein n=1 Tax=Heterorhabditis bacteriophora TaxID=37862 RepID=A0A1I7W783_HETBA